MARSAVLVKPNVANILLFNFREQTFVQHGPITIAIDCNGFSSLIFEEIWLNYYFGLKSAPNSDSFWVRRVFNVCMYAMYARMCGLFVPQMRQFCLYTYPPRSNWAASEKIIFLPKSPIFPAYKQAYTQPHSFGGRIKLIICQETHELSVIIHKIVTSWKKR